MTRSLSCLDSTTRSDTAAVVVGRTAKSPAGTLPTSIGRPATVKKVPDPNDSVGPAPSGSVKSSPAPVQPQTAIGYLTVPSDEPTVVDGVVETIFSACNRYRWRLVEVVRDRDQGPSALKRPGLSYVIGKITAGNAHALVVTDVDCLGRSIADLGRVMQWFCDSNARLVVLDIELDTATAAGARFAASLASLGKRERDRIARRSRSGLAELRAEGRSAGRPAVADRAELRDRIGEVRMAGMTLTSPASIRRLSRGSIPGHAGDRVAEKHGGRTT